MAPNKAGIYKITNLINGNSYYGSTENFSSRWSKHRTELRKGIHNNGHLQNAWNLYGESSFAFEVILYCPKNRNVILFYEQYYLDKYWDDGVSCYNIYKYAGSPTGYKHTKGAKQKISNALAGRKLSVKQLVNLIKINTGNTYWLNRHHSEESKQKMSEARKDKALSESHKKHISESLMGNINRLNTHITEELKQKLKEKMMGPNNPFYGKHHSEESKKKQSEARSKCIGEKNSNSKLTKIIADKIREDYILLTTNKSELARKYNVSFSTIKDVIDNKRWI